MSTRSILAYPGSETRPLRHHRGPPQRRKLETRDPCHLTTLTDRTARTARTTRTAGLKGPPDPPGRFCIFYPVYALLYGASRLDESFYFVHALSLSPACGKPGVKTAQGGRSG